MQICPIQHNYISNNRPACKGYSSNLQRCLDKTLMKPTITAQDKLSLIDCIKKVIPTTLVEKKFIEEGSHNSVYKITKKYVARIPNSAKITPDNVGNDLKIGENIFGNLKNYFGEAVVKLGSFQILNNVGYHTPVGVPEHSAKNMSKLKIDKYYLEKYLPKFAKVPQYGYNEIAKTISKINDIKLGERKYCVFDSLNPNNVVLRNGNLYLVDEIDTHCDRSYLNTTAKLFEVFLNRASKDYLSPCCKEGQKFSRKIFKKILLASSKADLIHANSKEDFVNWERALQRCGIKDEAYKVIEELEEIERNHKDLDLRQANTKIYINKLFVTNPIK